MASEIDLRVFKIGLTAAGAGRRACVRRGWKITVVEEKRRVIECQLRNGSTTGEKTCARA